MEHILKMRIFCVSWMKIFETKEITTSAFVGKTHRKAFKSFPIQTTQNKNFQQHFTPRELFFRNEFLRKPLGTRTHYAIRKILNISY